MRRRGFAGATLSATAWIAGCMSIDLGAEAAPKVQLALRDSGPAPTRRAAPIVDALLIQPLPGDALVDTAAIVYSRREHEYATYQLATWTDRPLRTLPRLLQHRLEAHGVAGAVGLQGDPLRADWLLTLAVEMLVHDVAIPPGEARLTFGAELYDRRQRVRVARRRFTVAVPAERADAPAAAAAMSTALTRAFDELVPWLEGELLRATGAARQPPAAVN
jgi:ABC-type uncharacterized transport system auxiliary subunit